MIILIPAAILLLLGLLFILFKSLRDNILVIIILIVAACFVVFGGIAVLVKHSESSGIYADLVAARTGITYSLENEPINKYSIERVEIYNAAVIKLQQGRKRIIFNVMYPKIYDELELIDIREYGGIQE